MSFANINPNLLQPQSAQTPAQAPYSPSKIAVNRKRAPAAPLSAERRIMGKFQTQSPGDGAASPMPFPVSPMPSSPSHTNPFELVYDAITENKEALPKEKEEARKRSYREANGEIEETDGQKDPSANPPYKRAASKANALTGHGQISLPAAAAASSMTPPSLAAQQIHRSALKAAPKKANARQLLAQARDLALKDFPYLREFSAAKQKWRLERFVTAGPMENAAKRTVIINAEALNLSYWPAVRTVWPEMDLLCKLIQKMTEANKPPKGLGRASTVFSKEEIEMISCHAQARILLHYHLCQLFFDTRTWIERRGDTLFQLFKGFESEGTTACHHSVLANVREGNDSLLVCLRKRIADHLVKVVSEAKPLDGKLIVLMEALGISAREIEELVASVVVDRKQTPGPALEKLWETHRLHEADALDENTLFFYLNNHTLVTTKLVNQLDDAIEAEMRYGSVKDLRAASNGEIKPVDAMLNFSNFLIQKVLPGLLQTTNSLSDSYQEMTKCWASYDRLFQGQQSFKSPSLENRVMRLQGIESTFLGIFRHAEGFNETLRKSLHVDFTKRLRLLPVEQWKTCLQMYTHMKKFSADLELLNKCWQVYQLQEARLKEQTGPLKEKIAEINACLNDVESLIPCTISEEERKLIKAGKDKNQWSWTAYTQGKYDREGLFRNLEFIQWRNLCVRDIAATKGNTHHCMGPIVAKLKGEKEVLEARLDELEREHRLSDAVVQLRHHVDTLERFFTDKWTPAIQTEMEKQGGLDKIPVSQELLDMEKAAITAQIRGTQAAIDHFRARHAELVKETADQALAAQIILASRQIEPTFVPPK